MTKSLVSEERCLRVGLRAGMQLGAKLICPRCAAGDPHHTNAASSIGGSEGRHPVYDLHVAEGGGLAECLAAPIWEELAKVRQREERGMAYCSKCHPRCTWYCRCWCHRP